MTQAASRRSDLAINGGAPVRTRPFHSWPVHGEEDVKAVEEVVRANKWWRCAYSATELEERDPDNIQGTSRVEAFESLFARAHGARHAVAVTSGSAALEIAVRACGIMPGDEVITTPYTFIATSTCIMNNFAVPVYTDIEADTYNMDADQIEGLITERTKAIIPVHFSGNLCNMEKIGAIARKHNLKVIEDAAHAHGVEYDGKQYAGTFGDFGCFSLQEAKNVATGEGGILLTNDRALYDKAFSLHHYGRIPGEIWYKHFNQGWNYRMNEVTGALAMNQTRRLKEQNERRMENYKHLARGLAEIPGLKLSRNDPKITRHSHHLIMIRYDKEATGGVHRDDIVAAVVKEGIPALTGYTFPNYANPFLASEETKARFRAAGVKLPDYPSYSERCPNTERACYEESIWLTHGLLLGTQEDMEDITEAFAKVMSAYS